MVCSNCQKTIDYDSKFCCFCGHKVDGQKTQRLWINTIADYLKLIGMRVTIDLKSGNKTITGIVKNLSDDGKTLILTNLKRGKEERIFLNDIDLVEIVDKYPKLTNIKNSNNKRLFSMYCKFCGKEIPENSKFCRYCGNKLVRSSEVASSTYKPEDSSRLEYAGFWIRLGAYSIDILGMVGGMFVIGFVLSLVFGEGVWDWPEIVWSYLSYVIYNTFTLSIWSTTFGKYLYGLRVLTEDKEDLDFGLALKRSLLQPLSTFLFGIGYWNMNKSYKKQAWHDARVGTIVVKEEKGLALAYVVTIIAVIVWAYLYSLGMGQ